jgi:hypothetical protein
MVFSVRQMVEKSIEQRSPLWICFIDLTKAFDSVDRSLMFDMLHRIGVPGKIVNLLQSIHTDMEACVRVDGEATNSFPIKTGVRQGCTLAPLLFAIYIQGVMDCVNGNREGNAEGLGVKVKYRDDGNMISFRGLTAATRVKELLVSDLMFADDTALIADSAEALQRFVNIYTAAAAGFGLIVNKDKSEVMCINDQPHPIYVNETELKHCETFKYLGSVISANGLLNAEMNARIQAANKSFAALYRRVWKQHSLYLPTKIAIYKTVVLSVLLYGAESWTATREHLRRLQSFHI